MPLTRKKNRHACPVSRNLLICKILSINNVITNGQLHVEGGQQRVRWVNKLDAPNDVAQPSASTNKLDAVRTQVKQEDNIARLWSVSCELFLNCLLLHALSRSKEHHCSLQFWLSVRMYIQYVHKNIQPPPFPLIHKHKLIAAWTRCTHGDVDHCYVSAHSDL